MMNVNELQQRLNEVKGTEVVNQLISFMAERGYEANSFTNVEKANAEIIEALSTFFETEVALDKVVGGENLNLENKENNKEDKIEEVKKVELTVVKPNEEKDNNEEPKKDEDASADDSKGSDEDEDEEDTLTSPKKETNAEIHKKYKTIHNIVTDAKSKTTYLENIHYITNTDVDEIYSVFVKGSDLATMWLNGTLTFDPTMQRGLKENTKHETMANFRDSHVRDIAESMKSSTFTPTQIHLVVLTDDPYTNSNFDEDNELMCVKGMIRLADGQHRVRALVKLVSEMKTGKIKNIDVDKYVFNVQIHRCKSDQARIIYANIDKNLKLDKSQVRQLSSDNYSRIVNELNTHGVLKGLISTTKPVGTKLVLFSNLAEAIEECVDVASTQKKDEVVEYLRKFFDHVAYRLPQLFGKVDARVEFRTNNLLAENNAFKMWIKVAFADTENYKNNIDKIAENVLYYNKDNFNKVVINDIEKEGHIWLLLNTVKHKQKGEGFAMNNTKNGIDAIAKVTFEMLGGVNK